METLQISRAKRSLEEGEDEDTWHEPSDGVKFSWALESLFAQVATYRNREMIYKLTGQVSRLARATKEGFRDLNIQLQSTTKMVLQNRLALDTLLLKEHGVCGFLKDRIDHCCIHIPNVTIDVEHDIEQLARVEQDAEQEEKDMTTSWLDKIFSGWNISNWVKSLLETIIILVIVGVLIWLTFIMLKSLILRKTTWNRTVMQTIARQMEPHPQYPPPASNNFGFQRKNLRNPGGEME